MIAAIVPAAGRSTRMGRPKLLMEFDGVPLIRRVVTALREGGADRVVAVPPVDSPEAAAIAAEAAAGGAEVVVPESQPAHMRDSVELGLAALDADPRPASIVLTPADLPGITRGLVARLLDVARDRPDRLLIPTHDGRRGHPIILPWSIAVRIRELPHGAGLNRLVARHREDVLEVRLSRKGVIDDLDTPEDLEAWLATRAGPGPNHAASPPGGLDGSRPAGTRITVCVRLFALAKERAGRSEVEVDLDAPATVGDLRAALRDRIPQLGPLAAGAMISVDEEYAPDETPIHRASRVALIPPVSGGGGWGRRMARSSGRIRPGSQGLP
jgi:molybdenum cofactor cytidylyltransferase